MIVHGLVHGLVGWTIYRAGGAFDRRVRVALLASATAGVVRLHFDHHGRRTP